MSGSHYEISPRERYDEEEYYRHEFGNLDEFAPADFRDDWESTGITSPFGSRGVSRARMAFQGHSTCEKCHRECKVEEEGCCVECGGLCRPEAA
jgi:hypothetical protein